MKTIDNKMSLNALENLIDRYFDGETTVEEESALRSQLALTSLESAKIDEAKAVMGFFAAQRVKQKASTTRRTVIPLALKVAAAVALVVAVGLPFLLKDDVSTDCYAYVNGERITAVDEVENMMIDQMSSLSGAVESDDPISDQLAAFAEAMGEE